MAVSFAAYIRPLFRDGDIDCMKPAGVHLDDATWMRVPCERPARAERGQFRLDASGCAVAERASRATQAMDRRRLSRLDRI